MFFAKSAGCALALTDRSNFLDVRNLSFQRGSLRLECAVLSIVCRHENVRQCFLLVTSKKQAGPMRLRHRQSLLIKRMGQNYFLIQGDKRTISSLRATDVMHRAAVAARWNQKCCGQFSEALVDLANRQLATSRVRNCLHISEEEAHERGRKRLLECV